MTICISLSQTNLYVSFSWTDNCLCVYHLVVRSYFNLLHNSSKSAFPGVCPRGIMVKAMDCSRAITFTFRQIPLLPFLLFLLCLFFFFFDVKSNRLANLLLPLLIESFYFIYLFISSNWSIQSRNFFYPIVVVLLVNSNKNIPLPPFSLLT